jgi:hypothetical protein
MTARAWAGAALLALVVTLVAAACGGEDEGAGVQVASLGETTTTDSGDDSTASELDPGDAMLAFARCMRENGVEVPDPQGGRITIRPGGGGGGASPERPATGERAKIDKARAACAEHLEGVRPQLSEADRAELQDAMLAYARCMREHGVDVPDPTFDGQGGGLRMRLESRDDPDFEEAQQACQSHLQELEDRVGPPRRRTS